MIPTFSGLFLREGTSDEPLADIVERLFARHKVLLRLTSPDLSRLSQPRSATVQAKIGTGLALSDGPVDLLVVHRDADAAGRTARVDEITRAAAASAYEGPVLPVIPVRMTESWLLLDEDAIRRVAGNPSGRVPLQLPRPHEAERVVDPKGLLQEALLAAADVQGRRRREASKRFPAHRRRLLANLDPGGAVVDLASFRSLRDQVAITCSALRRDSS